MKRLIMLTLAAALSGCVGVAVVDHEKESMVYVQNENLLLFSWLPICSGDPDYPNGEVANWWEDTVNVKNNVRLLEETRDSRGAGGLKSISTNFREEWVFWPILKRKVLGTSAELVK